MTRLVVLFIGLLSMTLEAIDCSRNPFVVPFPEKIELTNDDYLHLQKELRKIDLNPLLSEYYNELKQFYGTSFPYSLFYSRCAKFLSQQFIDKNKKLFPRKELVKINNGGDNCVVSSAPYAKEYPDLLLSQIKALKKTGFDGYYLLFLGAYPNPTGKEIAYAGVPYALKIFAMIEAQKLGFNKVLWLDSALCPTRDITPIFDEVEKTGFVAHHKPCDEEELAQLFPTTRNLLKNLTSVDVFRSRRIFATMIGLKMDHPLTAAFVQQYYDFVALGTPFVSGLPEEFVFSAILGQKIYAEWMEASRKFESLLPLPCFRHATAVPGGCPDRGHFFEWRAHKWVATKAGGRHKRKHQ